MKYVGVKGYSRYSDSKAYSIDEVKNLAKREKIFVVLNRIKKPEELERVLREVDAEGFILNDIGCIVRFSKFKKIIASVGLTPLNDLDLKLMSEIGAYAATIPPEVNNELKSDEIKIEAFAKALLEMHYKGKCLISAFFSGKSVKRDGVCGKECCRKWEVYYDGRKICETNFAPKIAEFDVDADLVKYEGRQFKGYGVIEYGARDDDSNKIRC